MDITAEQYEQVQNSLANDRNRRVPAEIAHAAIAILGAQEMEAGVSLEALAGEEIRWTALALTEKALAVIEGSRKSDDWNVEPWFGRPDPKADLLAPVTSTLWPISALATIRVARVTTTTTSDAFPRRAAVCWDLVWNTGETTPLADTRGGGARVAEFLNVLRERWLAQLPTRVSPPRS